MQGPWCSIINPTLLSQSSPLQSPKRQASYRPQTSLLPSSEPTCSLSEFPELRKHRTGVLDHHHRVSKTQAEQGIISCFVHLDSHSHRHNCLSPWSYCITPPTQNALRVLESRVPYSRYHTSAPFWRFS